MADICPICGLPKDICVCSDLSKEQQKIRVRVETRKFRKAIYERDNKCCVVCNKNKYEDRCKLSVHHIDYDKQNNFPQNCVSLCNSCHSKTNFNRTHWTKFFQSLLKERQGYQYTEDQKIILDFS